jgi:hypothetical protein
LVTFGKETNKANKKKQKKQTKNFSVRKNDKAFSFCLLYCRRAYRIAGSFNNFHGRLSVIFHILSDNKVGSTPRFAPGSKAKPTQMAVDDDEVTEVSEAAVGTAAGSGSTSKHTPLRGVTHQVKRKAGELFSGSTSKKK